MYALYCLLMCRRTNGYLEEQMQLYKLPAVQTSFCRSAIRGLLLAPIAFLIVLALLFSPHRDVPVVNSSSCYF